MNKEMYEQLNRQIAEEFKSAYIYLSMASDFDSRGLKGMSSWMEEQAKEEVNHGMKIFRYLQERGEKPVLEVIDKPADSYSSPREAFEAAYKHEKYITGCIHSLVKKARQTEDTAAEVFLHWFVEEQVEEEASAAEVLDKLEMVEKSPNGLYMLDRELGQRGAS